MLNSHKSLQETSRPSVPATSVSIPSSLKKAWAVACIQVKVAAACAVRFENAPATSPKTTYVWIALVGQCTGRCNSFDAKDKMMSTPHRGSDAMRVAISPKADISLADIIAQKADKEKRI